MAKSPFAPGEDTIIMDTSPNNRCTNNITLKGLCDGIRYTLSTALTLGCIILVCYGIGKGYAALPGPPVALLVIFVLVLVLLGYLEGLQVAILALERVPAESFKESHPRAYHTHKLVTAGRGINVQRFLVGRQFFVVFVVFLCAQLTTYPTLPREFLPDWLFVVIIDTGLPGALIVLAFGQLMPQLIAATHPRRFLNLFGAREVVLLTLCFESLGVTHFSWLLARCVKWLFCLQDSSEVEEDNEENSIFSMEEGRGTNVLDGDASSTSTPTHSATSEFASSGSGLPINPLLLLDKDLDKEYGSWQDVKTAIVLDPLECDTLLLSLDDLICEGATKGMEASSSADVASKATMGWLAAHSHDRLDHQLMREKQQQQTSTSTSASSTKSCAADPFSFYPSPTQLVQCLLDSKRAVPRYLLPPHHHKHIPPHIVAFDMVSRHERVVQRVVALEHELSGIVTQPATSTY